MGKVRVRYAPSPTGVPHIGNSRTSFFNWLFARHHGGKFILRIEDTDRARLVPKSLEKILEIQRFLGLEWDEGPEIGGPFAPYIQSERLKIYQEKTEELVKKNLAYKDRGAVRFRIPKKGETSWRDLVGKKKIVFKNETLEDFVILKSDGFPTYHLANVVDDYLMEITHVIRGDEWISSTPKHLLLYQAFGWPPPEFAHLPLILGADRAKLSKRHGTTSVLEYRDQGYLKEALLNFMVLLGFAPGQDKEIMTHEEMIAEFDLGKINTASPIFDFQKLNWFNGQWMRKLSDEELLKRLREVGNKLTDKEYVMKILPLIKERMVTLGDFDSLTDFFFEEPKVEEKLLTKAKNKEELKQQVTTSCDGLEKISDWTKDNLEKTIRNMVQKNKWETPSLFMTLRVAITGKTATPPLFETMEVLGKDKVLKRLQKAITILSP